MKPRPISAIRKAMLAGSVIMAAFPAAAAEVTPQRLLNADKEPQNWLMNHRNYNGQRFSPLGQINKDNVGSQVRLCGRARRHRRQRVQRGNAACRGRLSLHQDSWGTVYKIDGTSGDAGRIVWRMEPKQERQEANRGVALWGNLVISVANFPARVIATDKDSGQVVWQMNVSFEQPAAQITGAPLPISERLIIGASGGDSGVRDWIAALDAATGKLLWRKYTIPAPGEPGSETWKGTNNSWQTGGGALWVTGTYDPETNQTIWGTGNPVPMFDPTYRPGDNLFTNSATSWDPETGKLNWYFQYTPGDMWDYDAVGTHILIDAVVDGQPRKLVTHSARNGFLYTMDRHNGQIVVAKPYTEVTWTKGIDQKTGKPVDYDPRATSRFIPASPIRRRPSGKKACPTHVGGNNYWPSSYSPQTGLVYIAGQTGCDYMTIDTRAAHKQKGWNGGSYKTPGPLRKQPDRHRSSDGRYPADGASQLSELQRHARDRRRSRFPWARRTARWRRSRTQRWRRCGRSMWGRASRRRR